MLIISLCRWVSQASYLTRVWTWVRWPQPQSSITIFTWQLFHYYNRYLFSTSLCSRAISIIIIIYMNAADLCSRLANPSRYESFFIIGCACPPSPAPSVSSPTSGCYFRHTFFRSFFIHEIFILAKKKSINLSGIYLWSIITALSNNPVCPFILFSIV